MRYQVMMTIEIDARSQAEATDHAKKLLELFKNPLTKMSIESDGIRMVGGTGNPQVYNPKPI